MKRFFSCISICLGGLFLLAYPQAVMACSCARAGSVESSFSSAANVVVLKLQSVEKYAIGESGYGYGGVKQSKLVVEQSFKGTLNAGKVLTFGQGGGADCIWGFSEEEVGTEYLFYLGPSPVKAGLWAASTCSRSGPSRYRGLDLRYLREREDRLGKSRISGVLRQRVVSPVEGGEFQQIGLGNRKVFVSGNGKMFETKTDDDGSYELYDLPPGSYTIKTEKIAGYSLWRNPDESFSVELKTAEMVDQDFDFVISNRIRGFFFDARGKPLENVCLRLRPATGKEARGLFEMDCTNAKGAFEFDEIPAGTYVLVINEEDKVTAAQPFKRFYYPTATRREDAAELTIGPGQLIDDLIVTAPATADTIVVSGRLLLYDRKPASSKNTEYVSLEFFDDVDLAKQANREFKEASSRGELRSDGTFSIRILRGGKGRLVASMNTYNGNYSNCPALDRLIKASGKSMLTEVRSNEVRLEADGDVIHVELVFPFPSTCRMRIDE